MSKSIKTISVVFYCVYALLSLVSIFVGVSEVSENLDGWHGFTSGHSFIFVLMCLAFGIGAVINIMSLCKGTASAFNIVIGLLLLVLPLIIKTIANSLQGNVDTDFQYLILRNFQGFDSTSLFMIISGILSFITMLLSKVKTQADK